VTLVMILMLGSVVCDVIGQVCFKLGVGHDHDDVRGKLAFVSAIARSPWIVAGVLTYAIEFVLWYAALTIAPLSVAFPIAALSYCGVVIASRLILAERVSPRRWAGTIAVALGVAIISWPQFG